MILSSPDCTRARKVAVIGKQQASISCYLMGEFKVHFYFTGYKDLFRIRLIQTHIITSYHYVIS